jgi:hypothetical protein
MHGRVRSYGRAASNPTVIHRSDGRPKIGIRFLVMPLKVNTIYRCPIGNNPSDLPDAVNFLSNQRMALHPIFSIIASIDLALSPPRKGSWKLARKYYQPHLLPRIETPRRSAPVPVLALLYVRRRTASLLGEIFVLPAPGELTSGRWKRSSSFRRRENWLVAGGSRCQRSLNLNFRALIRLNLLVVGC